MKGLKIAIVFFFGISSIFSQHKINGKIIDENNEPLSYANIILYQVSNLENPKGTISDDKGMFVIENILKGKYTIEVSMLGFKTYSIKEFDLAGDKTFNIILKEETQTLNEVVIKSKRPVIKQTAEKLIVDLEKSEMINTNLQDVMRKIPGVLVTNNGISIAGNRGVRILINGKTTAYMDVETLLRDFPADNIAKIEVIEQPGAEYEASGSAAVINIILKKNIKLGTHGSVNSWIGEDQGFEWGSGFSIASYKNKLNWQLSTGISQPTWRDDLFLVRTVGNEVYDQTTREPYDPDNYRVSGNIDYYINKHHSVGIGGSFNGRNSTRIVTNETIISNDISSNKLFSENSFDRERNNFNFNTKKWKKLGDILRNLIFPIHSSFKIDSNLFLLNKQNKLFKIDVENNTITKYKIAPILYQFVFGVNPIYYKDFVYFLTDKGKINKIELSKLTKETEVITKFYDTQNITEKIILASVFIIILVVIFYVAKRYANTKTIKLLDNGIRFKNKFIELDSLSISIIKMVEPQDIELSKVYNLVKKDHLSKIQNERIKNQYIDQINLQLSVLTGIKEDFLIVSKSNFDKRYKIIRLNRAVYGNLL